MKNTPETPQFVYDPEGWRDPWPFDQNRANQFRSLLAGAGYYCAITRNDDPMAASETATHRKQLHAIVDELTPDDLKAVHDLARRLLICPDQVGVNDMARAAALAFEPKLIAILKDRARAEREKETVQAYADGARLLDKIT